MHKGPEVKATVEVFTAVLLQQKYIVDIHGVKMKMKEAVMKRIHGRTSSGGLSSKWHGECRDKDRMAAYREE